MAGHDHDQKLSELRNRREVLVQKQTKLTTEKEGLEKQVKEVVDELKEDYNIDDVKKLPDIIEQTEKEVSQLEGEIDSDLKELETAISKYEE